jgi:phosphatidylserine/phosphatidylglycerophosphate/cardiolipin synthase-like enzyme
MSGIASRVVIRTATAARTEIKELLAGVLAAELVAPSRRIWLVSPWLADVDLLDNRAAAFRGIGPGWGRRMIGLFDVLGEFTRRGSEVIVATRPGAESDGTLAALRLAAGQGPSAARLHCETRSQLHTKGLLGDDFCISGSMNFTRNGVEHLDEIVTYVTDPAQVGALRIEFGQEYGGAS